MTAPLASFPIASTSDPDEARSILSRELVDLRFENVRDPRAFRLDMNGVHVGRTMVGYNQFATDTRVDPGCVDGAVLLVLGVGSPTTFTIDGVPVVLADKGAIGSPSRRVLIDRRARAGILVLRAEIGALEVRLSRVLDRTPRKPLVFERSVDLTSGVGAHARRLLRFFVNEHSPGGAAFENPLLRAGFDDLLLNTLLALPSNYSDDLASDRQPSVAPRLVRHAEEYLEAHVTQPITISDLVAQCGCSRRALFKAFQRFRGYTPMQFLAASRLRLARKALRDSSPGDTVTSIALACGFSHLGRFSMAYRRRFGESPSETMRKA